MTWLIAFLIKRGMSQKAADFAGPIIFYVVAALLLWGAYGLWHHNVYKQGYDAAVAIWKPRLEAQTTAYAKAAADAEAANAKRVAEFTANNARITRELFDKTKEAAALRSDRDLARVLLRIARETAASRGEVPAAGDQPGAPSTGGAEGDGSLESTVTAAIGECRRNTDRLDALIAEIKPQLGTE
jgi:hypothetical protein